MNKFSAVNMCGCRDNTDRECQNVAPKRSSQIRVQVGPSLSNHSPLVKISQSTRNQDQNRVFQCIVAELLVFLDEIWFCKMISRVVQIFFQVFQFTRVTIIAFVIQTRAQKNYPQADVENKNSCYSNLNYAQRIAISHIDHSIGRYH